MHLNTAKTVATTILQNEDSNINRISNATKIRMAYYLLFLL